MRPSISLSGVFPIFRIGLRQKIPTASGQNNIPNKNFYVEFLVLSVGNVMALLTSWWSFVVMLRAEGVRPSVCYSH